MVEDLIETTNLQSGNQLDPLGARRASVPLFQLGEGNRFRFESSLAKAGTFSCRARCQHDQLVQRCI